jgi:ketosteroid isomerase-like protein
MEALAGLEERGEVEPLVALFSEEAEVGNVATRRTFQGREGARRFWREYKGMLGQVRSTYRNVVVSGPVVVLEWRTEGTAHNGAAVHYEGVSVVEWEGEEVVRFRAYFDARELGAELSQGIAPRTEAPATAPA